MFSEIKRQIAIWLSNSFWCRCIEEVIEAEKCLLIPTDLDMEHRKGAMMEAIAHLQISMTAITGSSCGVSIKVPHNPEDNPINWRLMTILRDPDHFERDNEKYKATVHAVTANTAYFSVVNKLQQGLWSYKYINNNRFEDPNYESSSDNCYPSLPQYVSEIVVPILLPEDDDDSTLHGLRGFLCVDCVKAYPFRNDEVTASLISIVAYLLQPLLTTESN